MWLSMNIIDKLKRFFKPELHLSQNIANVSGLIAIPNREQYKDNQKVLSLIDKYKEEYIIILRAKNTLLSNALTPQNLHDNMLMYIDLLLNINLDDKHSLTGNREVDILIKSCKLEMYLENIHDLSIESITRLIALKEIYEEEIFLNKRKRHRITYEIENLIVIFNIFMTNIYSIRLKYDAIKDELKLLDSNRYELTEEQNNLLQKYLNSVYDLVKVAYPNLDVNEYQGIDGVATLERELEIYAYSNKNEINILNEELKKIESSQVRLLADIEALELKYRIFDEYGRNLVTDDILLRLYKVKFDVLTANTHDYNKKVITDKTTQRELEFYKRIVMDMVDKIATNANEYLYKYFGEEFFGYKCSKATEYMLLILKDGQDNIDPERVLNDSFLLSALLCFANPSELGTFFKKYQIGHRKSGTLPYEYPPILIYPYRLIDLHNRIFSWDYFIPISTLFKFDNVNSKIKRNDNTDLILPNINIKDFKDDIPCSERIKSLKALYLLMFKPKYDFISYVACDDIMHGETTEKQFSFPEGLSGIYLPKNIQSEGALSEYDRRFLNGMLRDIDGAVVYTPDTLTRFSGDIFQGHSIKSIMLNEGLIELGDHALASQNLTSINIPSSLEMISDSALNYDALETVVFNDYKNNKILNEEEKLFDFLKKLIVVRPTGEVKTKMVVTTYDMLYGTATNYIDAVEMEAYIGLKEIILVDESGKEIRIDMGTYKRIDYIKLPTLIENNSNNNIPDEFIKSLIEEYRRILFVMLDQEIMIISNRNSRKQSDVSDIKQSNSYQM